MATCPRCKGPLTDSHRCPRRPLRVAIEMSACTLAGGMAGLLVAVVLDPHGSAGGDALLVVTGAVLGLGIERAIRS